MNNTLIILFLLIIIFYLFYQNLMNNFESKLNNLSLKINSSPLKVELPKEFKKYFIQSNQYNNIDGEKENNIELEKPYINNPEFLIENFDQYENKNKEFQNNQKSSHLCCKNHKHHNCNLGVMNYSDPNDLSDMDYKIFKLTYPSNMTMQDYVNWLYCYQNDEHLLNYNHLKNLDKLKRNIPLEEIKGVCPPPSFDRSPLDSDKYFKNLYDINNEFKIASHLNTQNGPIMAYNSEDYSEFNHNFDSIENSQIRNCDIGLKKSSKKVNDFIFPKDSNRIESTDDNKIYYQKNNEL